MPVGGTYETRRGKAGRPVAGTRNVAMTVGLRPADRLELIAQRAITEWLAELPQDGERLSELKRTELVSHPAFIECLKLVHGLGLAEDEWYGTWPIVENLVRIARGEISAERVLARIPRRADKTFHDGPVPLEPSQMSAIYSADSVDMKPASRGLPPTSFGYFRQVALAYGFEGALTLDLDLAITRAIELVADRFPRDMDCFDDAEELFADMRSWSGNSSGRRLSTQLRAYGYAVGQGTAVTRIVLGNVRLGCKASLFVHAARPTPVDDIPAESVDVWRRSVKEWHASAIAEWRRREGGMAR